MIPTYIIIIVFVLCCLIYIGIHFPIYILKGKHYTQLGQSDNKKRGISVILTAYNKERSIKETLESLINQDYENFEIIAVDQASTDSTSPIIAHMATLHSNLHNTYLPTSLRYISSEKMAYTLGIRGATKEWVLLMNADQVVPSKNWLTTVASMLDEKHDMLMLAPTYQSIEPSRHGLFTLHQFMHTLRHFHMAGKGNNSKAIGGKLVGLVIKKNVFMENGGFRNQLTQVDGDDSLFIDNHSTPGHTAVSAHIETSLPTYIPSIPLHRHTLLMQQAEAQRHLGTRGKAEDLLWACSTMALYGAILACALCHFYLGSIFWVCMTFSCLIVILSTECILAGQAASKIGFHFPKYLFPYYIVAQPFNNLYYRISSRLNRRYLMRRY